MAVKSDFSPITLSVVSGTLESNRPGVAQRLGVDYESVRVVKPDIVYCSLAGYGQDGPYRLLQAGHVVDGPAIVEEPHTAVVVPHGWRLGLGDVPAYEMTHILGTP